MRPGTPARLCFAAALAVAGCSKQTNAPAASTATRPEPRPVNVVFILLDAVRFDHLTPYGYKKNTTPFLESVAEKSVVFDKAYAVSTWTPSSMASIFTSLYVNQHGVLTGYRATKNALERGESVELNRIPSTTETLPEVMKGLGYRTFAVADNLNICERMGFSRGFDRFSPHNKEGSDVVNNQLRDWQQDVNSGGKYFLYVHYMDAHQPYKKQKPWYDARVKPAEESSEAYDSNLSQMDERIKEAFALFGFDKGSTLVVITADHGEELGDHGGSGHKNKLYNELLRVPLIVYYPERLKPRRVADAVSNFDLLPTFRELGGGKPSRFDQGVSLFKTLDGPAPAEPRVFFPMRWAEVAKERLVKKGVVRERWKYIVTLPEKDEELYDMETDPKEQKNLAKRSPDVVADLSGRLAEFEKTAKVFKREFAAPAHISPEQAEQLKALGYVQ